MANFVRLKAGFNQFYLAGWTFYILAGSLATLLVVFTSMYSDSGPSSDVPSPHHSVSYKASHNKHHYHNLSQERPFIQNHKNYIYFMSDFS